MIVAHCHCIIWVLLVAQSTDKVWSDFLFRLRANNVVSESNDAWYISQNRESAMYFCGYVEGRISIQLSDEFIGFLKRRFEGRDGRTELYPLMSESLRMGKELREKGAQTICGTRLDPNSLKLQEILMPAVSCCKTDKGIAATFASSINGHGSICLIDASGKQLWKRQLEMHKSQRLGITSTDRLVLCFDIQLR